MTPASSGANPFEPTHSDRPLGENAIAATLPLWGRTGVSDSPEIVSNTRTELSESPTANARPSAEKAVRTTRSSPGSVQRIEVFAGGPTSQTSTPDSNK